MERESRSEVKIYKERMRWKEIKKPGVRWREKQSRSEVERYTK